MLLDKNGEVLNAARLEAARSRANPAVVKSARSVGIACGADRADVSNFLRPGDGCCYCGVERARHHVGLRELSMVQQYDSELQRAEQWHA